MTFLRKLIAVAAAGVVIPLAGAGTASAVAPTLGTPEVLPATQQFGGLGSGPTQEAALTAAIADAQVQASAAGYTAEDCSLLGDPIIMGGVRPGFPLTYHALVTLGCTTP
ncbi:hypothetical protein [Nonomuraea sp. NPDC002799]